MKPIAKQRASDRPTRWLLTGYFDRGNFGDDAMREALVGFLEHEVSGAMVRCASLPPWGPSGLRPGARLIRDLTWADVVVLSGGTHFHDGFGLRSVRILGTFLVLFSAVRALGAKVALAGVGVGPLRGRTSRLITRRILRQSSAVFVRDHRSASVVREIAPDVLPIEGFDCAAILKPARPVELRDAHVVGVSLLPFFSAYRQDPPRDALAVQELSAALRGLRAEDPALTVRVLVFSKAGRDGDCGISRLLVDALAPDVPAEMVLCDEPQQVLAEVARLGSFVAMRYHAALFGYLTSVPMIMVAYDEKCTALAEQLRFPAPGVLTPDDLLERGRIVTAIRATRQSPASFRSEIPVAEAAWHAHAALREFAAVFVAEDTEGAPAASNDVRDRLVGSR